MAVLLSLVAALSYGCSDFVGGIGSRRTSAWSIALTSQLGGAAAVVLVGLVSSGSPTSGDLAWAALAGVGNGLGTSYLYRGLGSGRMGVVAPVSGVGAAVLPVIVGVTTGDRPGLLVWIGIVVALPAIWLVASQAPGKTPVPRAERSSGLIDGVVAGLGFGTLFVALGQLSSDAGLLPFAVNQFVGAAVVVVTASAVGASWRPRHPAAVLGLVSGTLGAGATLLFAAATRHGLLAVAAVITSLYPAFTVLLAALVLREHVHRRQGAGLALCAASVVLSALPG